MAQQRSLPPPPSYLGCRAANTDGRCDRRSEDDGESDIVFVVVAGGNSGDGSGRRRRNSLGRRLISLVAVRSVLHENGRKEMRCEKNVVRACGPQTCVSKFALLQSGE